MVRHIELRSTWRRRCLITTCLNIALAILPLLVPTAVAHQLRGVLQTAQSAQSLPGSPTSSQGGSDVRELASGTPVERDLATGQAHTYRITLNTGQYLHVTIDQRGIDVIAVLRGPDGAQLMEMDGIGGLLGAEELSWEAASGGVYVVEVKAKARQANTGRYELKAEKAAEASGQGRARIAAERLFMEGRRAQEERRGEALERAIKKYVEAVEKWRGAGDRKWEAQTLNNLGIVYELLSQYEKARGYYEQSLAIMREVRDRRGEGLTLNGLGIVYWRLSQHEKARDYYEQSLAIKREIKDRYGEGATLNNLGIVYESLNQDQKASDYYEQSLAVKREIKDRRGEGKALHNLALIYRRLGQYEKARDYLEQTLAIMREIKDRYVEGYALHNLGIVHESLGQYEKARDYYEQALAIRREIKDRHGEGTTLNGLGVVCESLGQYEKARGYLEQSLAIMREIKDSSGEAFALFSIASFERDRGNLSEAHKQIQSALAIIESLRTNYTNQDLRAAYFATVQNSYEFYIDLLMRLHKQDPAGGHERAALQASERARARTLLDTLAEAGADIRQGVDPQLVTREHSLQQRLNDKAQQQVNLLGGQHTAEQAAALAREIEALTGEYQQVQAQIRRTSPRYAALTQPAPLSVKEIQAQVLDAETLLLEYSMGKERSYVWAVTQTSITSHALPKREEIEQSARRVYGLLTARNQHLAGETPEQWAARVERAEAEYAEAASALSRMLLAPVADRLGTKRLIIVSEGALQYVPFGALPAPKSPESGVRSLGSKNVAHVGATDSRMQTPESRPPLIVDHEIVTLPSASVLAVLRRELKGRPPAPKAVAVLADPVFRGDDPRVKTEIGKVGGISTHATAVSIDEDNSSSEITRSARESGLTDFKRLRFSRQEAEAIASLLTAGGGLKAIDFAANRATATSPELSRYRVLHFATHGLLNSQHPELSGIVLSLVDEQGRPQDGFLRLHEIYNLRLGADLVVLSACQTALGKEIKGEGLVGLTRGFMYAGAPRVVASLWNVDDRATAEMMKRFYAGLLRDGRPPAEALRAAQVSMLRERRWQSPFYWAAFVAQGEWK